MTQDDPLAGLPEPDEPVFYPKVGHCIYRGVIEDAVAPGTQLLELEDLEEGSRILIPVGRVPALHLRPAGVAFEAIKEVLSADFELPIEDDAEREQCIEELITDGAPASLAKALKHLHLMRQTTGLSREEELTRKKIRSWLAAEVSLARESTRAEAQAFMTRILQEAMASHRRKEKEEAKERRRVAKEQKKAEEEQEREREREREQALEAELLGTTPGAETADSNESIASPPEPTPDEAITPESSASDEAKASPPEPTQDEAIAPESKASDAAKVSPPEPATDEAVAAEPSASDEAIAAEPSASGEGGAASPRDEPAEGDGKAARAETDGKPESELSGPALGRPKGEGFSPERPGELSSE